jgi:hypothetical protein
MAVNKLLPAGTEWNGVAATTWSLGHTPTAAEDVEFEALSKASSFTLGGGTPGKCRSLHIEAGWAGTFKVEAELEVGNNEEPAEFESKKNVALKLSSAMTFTANKAIKLIGTSKKEEKVFTAGKTLETLTVGKAKSSGTKYLLEEALTARTALTVEEECELNTKGFKVEVTEAGVTLGAKANVTLEGSEVVLPATGTVWNAGANVTLSAASSTIKITGTSATLKQFKGGGYTYGTLTITGNKVEVTGSNTFKALNLNNPGETEGTIFEAATTQTVEELKTTATETGKRAVIKSSETGTGSTKLVGTEIAGTTLAEVAIEKVDAQQFEAATGTINVVAFKTSSETSTATSVIVGIAKDSSGKPEKASIEEKTLAEKPAASTLYEVAGFNFKVTAGTKYWLFVLPLGGALKIKYTAEGTLEESNTPAKVKKASEVTVWSSSSAVRFYIAGLEKPWATLHKASGNVNVNFLKVTNSHVDASPKWYAGTGSENVSGNENWLFEAEPVAVVGKASGAVALTGTAKGSAAQRVAGAGSGAVTLTGSASGALKAVVSGKATGSLLLTGSAVGSWKEPRTGKATGTLTLTGSAAGSQKDFVSGAATGRLTLTGTASGVAAQRVSGKATGSLILTGTAKGQLAGKLLGKATGALALTGSATGSWKEPRAGKATGALLLTGTATGSVTAIAIGKAAGILALTGTAAGRTAAVVFGKATGTLILTGTSTGITVGTIAPPCKGTITNSTAVLATIINQKASSATITNEKQAKGELVNA